MGCSQCISVPFELKYVIMNINAYITENKDTLLNELLDILRIPSVSADPAYAKDVRRMAEVTRAALEKAGADNTELIETDGFPIVFGEKIIDPSKKTILVYGHYDVQPADPIELWDSPPFEPVIKPTAIHPEGAIFASGACDDKGQFFMHVKAFEYMMKTNSLPCNVKLIIEGEEEVGTHVVGRRPQCGRQGARLGQQVPGRVSPARRT